MKDTYSLKNFLKMLYMDSNIPSYLYSIPNQKFLHAEPVQTELTYPPA